MFTLFNLGKYPSRVTLITRNSRIIPDCPVTLIIQANQAIPRFKIQITIYFVEVVANPKVIVLQAVSAGVLQQFAFL